MNRPSGPSAGRPSGGFTGRPAGNPSSRPGGSRPSQGQRPEERSYSSSQRGGSSGNGLLIPALLVLLFGNKNSKSPLGRILRIAALVIVIVAALRACGILGGNSLDSISDFSSYSSPQSYSTPVPAMITESPSKTPAPTRTPSPTPKPAAGSSGSQLGAQAGGSAVPFSGNSSTSASGTAYGSTGACSSFDLSSVFGGHSTLGGSSYNSSGWVLGSNCGNLDTSVASGSRSRFTALKGNGKDTVTVMIYMCGTDLESKGGMATKDLQEMANATIADNVNILVYTGGCTGWRNNLMSSSTNQIYKVESGGSFRCVEKDMGNKAMVTPSTLAEFIQYCSAHYPASRNMLIFWDHGGGSLSGYGYDQRFQRSGSMNLSGIDEALSKGGVKFDIIGFDACLMATVETAEVCSRYGDYLLASEESEPGTGWYYTNWITMLSGNSSVSSLELGKKIVDDFVDVSARQCSGQDTTLSLVDLAEFSHTVPSVMNAWADSTAELILSDYRTVSSARSGSKEFAADSRIDHVDLTHIAASLNTEAGNDLAETVLGTVKYNRTSSSVKNAYGLSVYFPYRSTSSTLNTAVSTYSDLGFGDSYTRCIQAYAKYAQSGQAASYSSGYSSALGSLLSGAYSTGSSSSSYGSSYSSSCDAEDLYSLLYSMLGGRSLSGAAAETEQAVRGMADGISNATFDASALVWKRDKTDGKLKISLPEEQWDLLNDIKLNLFLDDGEGFIDYGLDFYSGYFDEAGNLIGEFDNVWLTVNDWPVAYYQMYTVVQENGSVVTAGRVPCLYNGERANLLIEITDDVPRVTGVIFDYRNGNQETETIAKSVTEFQPTDTVTFIADYYDYDNNYLNSYAVSDEMTLGTGLTADYKYLSGACKPNACYRLTDLYAQEYWTPVMANGPQE